MEWKTGIRWSFLWASAAGWSWPALLSSARRCCCWMSLPPIWDVFHLLDEMNRRGTTIVMATHAKMFVNMMRKRVITLVDGKVFGDVAKGRYGDII